MTMRKWMWAAAACLIGVPAANAEYAILRYQLNKPPAAAVQGMIGLGALGCVALVLARRRVLARFM